MGFCLVSFFKHCDKNPACGIHWISQRVRIIAPIQWNPPFWKKLHFLTLFLHLFGISCAFCSFFVGPFFDTFCHFLALDGPLLHFLALFWGGNVVCHLSSVTMPTATDPPPDNSTIGPKTKKKEKKSNEIFCWWQANISNRPLKSEAKTMACLSGQGHGKNMVHQNDFFSSLSLSWNCL